MPAAQAGASILGNISTRPPELGQGPEVWRSHLCSRSQIKRLIPQDSKSHSHSLKGKPSPLRAPCLHAPTTAGRLSLSWLRFLHRDGWDQCLWAPGSPGQGSASRHSCSKKPFPGERPAAATCLLSCPTASLPWCNFCWESCKISGSLEMYSTMVSCCFSQCGRMQLAAPRAQGSFTCSRGEGHPYPVQPPFSSPGICSKGKTVLIFYFPLRKNKTEETPTQKPPNPIHHHDKLSYLNE